MISCEHPKIVINQAVYEAVAFTKYVIANGIQYPFYNVSKLNISVLYDFLKRTKQSISEELLPLYYTYDRFGFQIPLFVAVPCRKCLLCLQKDANILAQRLEFESEMHDNMPWFITLTFAPAFLPKDNKLRKRHCELYIKRLREYVTRWYNCQIRYYYQGEHGLEKGRMHYHFLIFGLPIISFYSALKLFKSAWRSKKYISCIVDGKVKRIRPLIGRVGVSQINSKEYRAYYERTRKRSLNPEDGIQYACKYSSKDGSSCRGWSNGLGKAFVLKHFKPLLHQPNAPTDLKFCNRYGKIKPVILSRWLLQTCFDTFNRKTYYLRSKIIDCIGSSSFLHNSHWYFDKYKELYNFVGIRHFSPHLARSCFEYILEHRSSFNPCKSMKSRFTFLKFEHYFDKFINTDFQYFFNETRLYNEYIQRYFANRLELNKSQVSQKAIKANQYHVKQLTLLSL